MYKIYIHQRVIKIIYLKKRFAKEKIKKISLIVKNQGNF